jgi:hypothetical protein
MAIIDKPARPDAEERHAAAPGAQPPVVLATAVGALAAIVAANLLDAVYVGKEAQVAALIAGSFLVAVAVRPRTTPWVVGGLLGTWLLAQGLYAVVKGIHYPPPVARAVGAAAYFDASYIPTQVLSVLLLLAAFAAAAWATRRYGAALVLPVVRVERRASLLRRPETRLAIGTAVLAFSLQPDLWARLRGAGLAPVAPSWDAANFIAWDSFLERGLEPVRDFFYPYGHLIAFNATPWGPMWQWFAHSFLLAVAAWAFWRLTDRSLPRTLLAVAATTILISGWWYLLDRYLPGMLMGIVYAAIGPGRHRRPTLAHLLLGLVAFYTAWLEPDVLLVGLGTMTFLALGELVAGRLRVGLRELARRFAVDAAPLALVALVPLLWVAEGSFDENVRFWSSLPVSSYVWALPPELLSMLSQQRLTPTPEMLALLLPPFLLIGGLVLGRLGTRRDHAASMLLLIGAAAAQVMLLKCLVRVTTSYVMIVSFTALVFVAILVWDRRSAWLAGVVGVFAGLAFVSLQQARIVTTYVSAAVQAPAHFVASAKLRGEYAEVRQGERNRFARERFATWPDVAVADRLKATMASSPNKTFAVVGDSPLLYTLMNQAPPYQVELYNSSRIEEQRVFVKDLVQRRTEFIVYRREMLVDMVPQAVRVPLIFDYMIRNYVPVSRGPTMDILKRRGARPIPVNYWRSRLDTEDLGFIPAQSGGAGASACTGGQGCVPYAVVHGHTTKKLEKVLLRITGPDGTAFGAVLSTRTGQDTYAVRLDRLWFAALVGPSPRVEVQAPATGWSARLERHKTGDALY